MLFEDALANGYKDNGYTQDQYYQRIAWLCHSYTLKSKT